MQTLYTRGSAAPSFAYLGPAGTYTDEAARAFAARLGIEDPDLVEFSSFDEVFDSVDRGRCEFGVVGKENALEGPVTATLDNFALKSSATILGEEVLDIHHCLLLQPGAKIEDVTRVASHAQGLAQCRRFITERLPGRASVVTASTADSARLVAEDPTVAGIANAFAADLYGVSVVARDIEDHFGNQTVFSLIGRQGHAPVFSGTRYKTSVALFMGEDRPGTLNMILTELAYANINLTLVQSRPTKQALGDYMFFIEFEGGVGDLAVQTALNCLRLKLREVKVVGSYPVA
ncbi:prephenate dehydratase [Xiamenia xianingshaonis]|uniref:Prephenate dehydratase n=1 Tax=Xiamenia xianingshaonis TaxID=2682776 RepID=A0A9E6SV33_9ACTN|nr:prephenate dehydratase [Xiamenia xianingshaonis]NHM14368.1 prephenate dehydratase [Xiamenia xianingshaonis]QTU84847.1 prephenate dehydratase [Xiamenia xianingshaonis]